MKGWLISLGVHLLLFALIWLFPGSPVTPVQQKKAIQAFSYTPPKAAVFDPLPAPVSAAEPATPAPAPAPAPAKPVNAKTDAQSPVKATPVKPARAPAEPKTESASPMQTTPATPPAKRGSLASRALSSAAGARSAPEPLQSLAELKKQRDAEQTRPSEAPPAVQPAKTIKKMANGSELVKTADGSCWQIPPPEQRKTAIWTGSSIPCEPDRTVEQLNEIFKKRREMRRD